MATITAPTVLRHVRKTIAFNGGANNGNLGDDVPVFTTTGRVWLRAVTTYISEALVCSASTGVYMALGTSTAYMLDLAESFDFTGATGFLGNSGLGEVIADAVQLDGAEQIKIGVAVSGNIVLKVEDAGAGADITDGTLIIDCWYYPITDDGALTGDDIDTILTAAVVNEWESQSQADPTGFHVNVLEIGGTAQTANDNGADINAILADTNELQGDWTDGGRLDLIIDGILTDTGTTLQNELDGIQADTEDIQSRLPAALVGGRIDATVDATGMESGAVDAIWDEVLEGSYTGRQLMRAFTAALAGKVSGAGTTTITFRNTGDSKDVITATVDVNGNRSEVTLDLT